MNEAIDYNFWVFTIYKDSTKGFHTLIEALMYFDTLNESASLYDYTRDEDGEELKYKY